MKLQNLQWQWHTQCTKQPLSEDQKIPSAYVKPMSSRVSMMIWRTDLMKPSSSSNTSWSFRQELNQLKLKLNVKLKIRTLTSTLCIALGSKVYSVFVWVRTSLSTVLPQVVNNSLPRKGREDGTCCHLMENSNHNHSYLQWIQPTFFSKELVESPGIRIEDLLKVACRKGLMPDQRTIWCFLSLYLWTTKGRVDRRCCSIVS